MCQAHEAMKTSVCVLLELSQAEEFMPMAFNFHPEDIHMDHWGCSLDTWLRAVGHLLAFISFKVGDLG